MQTTQFFYFSWGCTHKWTGLLQCKVLLAVGRKFANQKIVETTIRLSEKPLEVVKSICWGEESGHSWGYIKATLGTQILVSERGLHPFEIHSCESSLESGTSLWGVKVYALVVTILTHRYYRKVEFREQILVASLCTELIVIKKSGSQLIVGT